MESAEEVLLPPELPPKETMAARGGVRLNSVAKARPQNPCLAMIAFKVPSAVMAARPALNSARYAREHIERGRGDSFQLSEIIIIANRNSCHVYKLLLSCCLITRL